MNSAIHLGLEYVQNLIACQNTNIEGIKTLFDISLRLIVENSFEILNLTTMLYDFSPWMRMTLCHDQPTKWAKTKVHVYSDSVLCMGRAHQLSEASNRFIISINPTSTQNYLKLMKNQLSLSRKVSQGSHRLRFSDIFSNI